MLRWVTRHRKSTAAGALVTAVSVALGILAFTYDGFTTTDVDLNDGGVWVTKQDSQQLGRINVQAEELDAGLISPTADFDVLQDDAAVLLHNREASSVMIVDPVQVVTGAVVQLPPQGEIALNGGTVVIVDPADGDLWAMPFADIGGYSAESTEPLLELGEGAAATVDRDGTVHAVSPRDGQQLSIAVLEEGGLGEPTVRDRGELAGMQNPVVSAVGGEPVVLDTATSTLLVPGGAVEAPADAAVQLVGDASDRVILATPTSLIRQPLGGGEAEVQQRQGGGEAVEPVQLGGCVYAVWPGSSAFLRDCADDARDLDQPVDGMDGSPVAFRINRDQVVLNQFVQGNSWLLADTLVLVDNWQDLVPPQSEEQSDEEDSESTEDLLTNQPPPINEENTDPIANDDDFGARTGRSTMLPVLWNDSDPDGDVLTARVVGELPAGVQIAPVANDSQLQVELPADFAPASFTVDYRVADGRGGEDDGRVTVRVRGEGENSVPEPMREQAFAVEQGGEYEYQVLSEWVDPDGDDMYLRGATTDSGDTIQTDPSGRLIYTATGEVGIQTVVVTVSDGRADTTAEILVDVRERGDAPPLANADFVSTVEGREATARPLLNDFSPSGRPLRLASVEPNQSLETTVDLDSGTIRVTGGPVGSHYLTYLVADGALSSTGRIRVDIRTPDDEARPVAVRDTALLPQQGSTLVDLLANDVDPAGGVLVVQQFTIESAAPVTVELRDRRILSIVDNRLEAPFQLTYTVSNGRFSEIGTVEVIPVTPPTQPRPPKAVDDQATVRAGDYATVDVTGNDFSPDGTPFTIERIVETSFASEEEGVAFLSEGKLRVHALEGAPTRATVTYEIADGFGNRDSATVAITIVPREAEQNTPPAPETVTSRVLAGSTVRIPIPLDGIDPDGDGVELVGYDTAPEGGLILRTIGPDYFDFEAFPGSAGTVEFTYRVRDRWGADGTATVVIGIAQAADVNQTPFAQPDLVTVRPDRAVAIAVLENDSDPDQDALSLQSDRLELPTELEGAVVNGERSTVDLRSPSEPGVYQFTYGVVDARGASTTGTVMLTVAEDAELQPPVARDDPLPRDDLEVDVPLDVPVLENDLDADGDPSDLELSVVTGPGRVVGDTIQVTPSDAFQVVTYRATDLDGLTAEAFVSVPPVRDRAPFLASAEPVQVGSGIELQMELREYVTVSTTNTPRITTGEKVTAVNSDGGGLIVDNDTLRFQSPAGYVGPASITFEVTDGTGPDNGNLATLTIPIEVVPSSVVPPTFAGAVVRAEAGEGAATFDLRDATSDPDPGDLEAMRFESRGGSMAGVVTSLSDDGVFSATAEVNTPPGASGSFQIVVIDPHGNEAPGTVVVEVVATNRPLAQARPDSGEATASIPLTTDVIANDFNPYQNEGRPLRVISAEIVAGDGAVSNTDREVTVTPGTDFSGVLTVRYTVEDATERIERQVSGTLTLNVKARPDAPPRPNVDAVGDSEVTLTWAPPSANGAPITGYVVRSTDGAISFPCSATTCTITGLVNNTTYTFQVVAQNEVGDSDPSAASNEARPDVRPEQPAPPSVVRGDTQVLLSWEPPVNRGSPIQSYTVEISPPAPGGVVQQQAAGTSHTWTGLTNGVAYQFRIQAVNLADEPSDFSAYSQSVTPAGPPMQVQGVSATPNRDVPGEVQMRVQWTAPDANGAPITGYTVTPSNGAAAAQVTGTTASFRFDATGENVTFTVTATNDAGTSQPSAPSAPVRVFTAPAAPSNVAATEGDTNSNVTFTPGSTNGARENEVQYQVSVNGGGWQPIAAGGGVVGGLGNNGGPYSFVVRAVTTIDGQQYAGASSSSSNAVRPYGAIGAPSASGTGQVEQVTFTWSAPARNGRDISTRIRIGNGSWQGVANNGTQSASANGGQTVTITVETTTGAPEAGHGAQTTTATAQATAERRLSPSITLSKGDAAYPGDCQGANGEQCRFFQLNWNELRPGTYQFACHNTGSSNGDGNAFESGNVAIGGLSGSTQFEPNGERLCYSGFAGQAYMYVWGGPDNIAHGNLRTPNVRWP
ncbi:Ig-like domain-containing protein [Agrococcus jenensis]|uniref:Fibronectin type III domain protein n=1 Tax=Agrococcus jenensis TaxID=46353 RepID=A0A3N2ASE1_9MICO|nr:Ig-like domain-containing protein [Agrococcus jenensis]ROR65979.1 fibronectin type III domain protein [Agrococcus jenensis]